MPCNGVSLPWRILDFNLELLLWKQLPQNDKAHKSRWDSVDISTTSTELEFYKIILKMQMQMTALTETEHYTEKNTSREWSPSLSFPLSATWQLTSSLSTWFLNISSEGSSEVCHGDVHWGLFLKSGGWQKDFVLEILAHRPFNVFVLFAFLI